MIQQATSITSPLRNMLKEKRLSSDNQIGSADKVNRMTKKGRFGPRIDSQFSMLISVFLKPSSR